MCSLVRYKKRITLPPSFYLTVYVEQRKSPVTKPVTVLPNKKLHVCMNVISFHKFIISGKLKAVVTHFKI